jgi:quercetin dioxygenase-like cupin family protein
MTTSDRANAPAYKVKHVEPVIKGSDVQARVFTLAPGEAIPWHYHRQSTDHYFVLEGVLSISTRGPDAMERSFPVGTSHKILPGTPHFVANGGSADCRFLLLQGVGAYDWIAAE